ncbi:MAG TPA: 16S rRNA (uracil(1498)-N(3))-methyltransferase [Casimicrobiaceae bacterium]|nr:16S rRNA (uracil(1498)-N(3))-methyltransferase [Casimicrobiaceae bacterium]
MTPRFHCPLPLAEGAEIALPAAAAHHCARVLRLSAGDAVTLFAGDDGEFAGRLVRVGARGVTVRIGSAAAIDRESPLAVTLVQALATADRIDYAVQKAVELGARAVQPIVTARGVARLDPARTARRAQHWRQIAIAACEQCGRNRVPEIGPPLAFDRWIAQPSSARTRLLLAPDGDCRLVDLAPPEGPVEILVGPEGGFTSGETAAALAGGFRALTLGPRILRTETAGPAALAAINVLWGDWGRGR